MGTREGSAPLRASASLPAVAYARPVSGAVSGPAPGAESRGVRLPSRLAFLRLPRLTPAAYRKITFVAGVLLAIIIVTGGAVRLTQSGLGCSDWPNCSPGHLVPRGAAAGHGWIEYTNRLFTGAVSFAVIIAVLGSLARVPRRKDLVWLSVGLVLGVLAQIVLG